MTENLNAVIAVTCMVIGWLLARAYYGQAN